MILTSVISGPTSLAVMTWAVQRLAILMVDSKVECMLKAKEYEFDYWDGDRRHGYGGYKYDGRWKPVAERFIEIYQLPSYASILDVGCGKAFLLHELKQLLPDAKIVGHHHSCNIMPTFVEEIQVSNLPFDLSIFNEDD